MISSETASVALWLRRARVLAVIVFVVALSLTAWLNDDGFITLRSVDNFLSGAGLRWNPSERVQSFTHPLWLLLLVPLRAVVSDPFLALHFLGIVCSAWSLWIAVSGLSSVLAVVGLLAIALSSRAFLDYSSSGLENPLLHILVAIFFTLILRRRGRPEGRLTALGLLMSAAYLTRPDAIILFLPGYLWAIWDERDVSWRVHLRAVVIGASPAVIWTLFALFYFGFPLPNTAYAKLGHGVPRQYLVEQGVHYLLNSLRWDPLTLALMALAGGVVLMSGSSGARCLYGGVVAYLLYCVWIGGDYMAGRFLSAPLFLAALLLVDLFRTKGCCLVVLLSIGALLFGPRTVFASFQIPSCRIEDAWRIADQRLRYQGWTSPRNYKDRAETAIERLFGRGVRFSQPDGRVVVSKAIGMPAFFRLAGKIIVDPYALSDPLLARLPVANPDSWRIGHFKRDIPAGYLETLETGANSIEDPALREYYDKLTILTQGDLWSWERLKTILRFNMGRYENLRFDYVERVRPAVASSGRRVVRVPERAAKGPECALW